ncbi:sodium:solute symporter family transporter [Poriferisphaera sp. WC338]|uniref:sodium:solute symporter family transporter n=1 Tax=Poriferisphaera sp. WC338 TaxID=3425129 RepID=UPI003D8182D7
MSDALPYHEGLNTFDWMMILAYAALMLGLGIWYFRKQTDVKEYFIAGKGMGAMVVGISQFATLVSTISYLGAPGETIKHGPVMLASILSLPFAYIIVGYILIPRLVKERHISAYALLEAKLGITGRILGATMFIILRLMWMTAMVYISTRAMLMLFGLPIEAQPWLAIGLGSVAVAYTALGGIRAVVVTDFIQFILLLGGALLTLICITWAFGGISPWFPKQWDPSWSQQPIFPADPYVRVTLIGTIVHFTAWYTCTAGGDQTIIQRFMSTPNAKKARHSYAWGLGAYVVVLPILGLVGFALMAFFKEFPQAIEMARDADDHFLLFIVHHLPRGAAGLVVVALCAAAMSSLDSGISSVSSVVISDCINRFKKNPDDANSHVKQAMLISVAIGVIIVLFSSIVGKVEGNITDIAFKTANLFTSPLFGLFFLVFFIPFANPFGAVWGAIYGMAGAIYLAYWDSLTGDHAISIQWITIGSLLIDIIAGIIFSAIAAKCNSQKKLVIWSILAALPILVFIVMAV